MTLYGIRTGDSYSPVNDYSAISLHDPLRSSKLSESRRCGPSILLYTWTQHHLPFSLLRKTYALLSNPSRQSHGEPILTLRELLMRFLALNVPMQHARNGLQIRHTVGGSQFAQCMIKNN